MVVRVVINEWGELVGIREPDGIIIVYGDMPVHRQKFDPMEGKPRWREGSFLDEQQAVDEEFTRKMHIA